MIYSLCIVNETSTVVVSKSFSGALLLDECHTHLMEDIFDESCPEVTTAAETTTFAPENKGPTSAQRMYLVLFYDLFTLVHMDLGYGYGFLAVFIISVLSVVGLLAVPMYQWSHFSIYSCLVHSFSCRNTFWWYNVSFDSICLSSIWFDQMKFIGLCTVDIWSS